MSDCTLHTFGVDCFGCGARELDVVRACARQLSTDLAAERWKNERLKGYRVAFVAGTERLYSRGSNVTSTTRQNQAALYTCRLAALADRDHWRNKTCFPKHQIQLIRVYRKAKP